MILGNGGREETIMDILYRTNKDINCECSNVESFEKIKHRKFPGGRLFRMPLLVTISAMQRMADIFNV